MTAGAAPVLRLALSYWRGWLVVLAATLLSSGVRLLQPWPQQLQIDHVFRGHPASPRLAIAALAVVQVVLIAADLALVTLLSDLSPRRAVRVRDGHAFQSRTCCVSTNEAYLVRPGRHGPALFCEFDGAGPCRPARSVYSPFVLAPGA